MSVNYNRISFDQIEWFNPVFLWRLDWSGNNETAEQVSLLPHQEKLKSNIRAGIWWRVSCQALYRWNAACFQSNLVWDMASCRPKRGEKSLNFLCKANCFISCECNCTFSFDSAEQLYRHYFPWYKEHLCLDIVLVIKSTYQKSGDGYDERMSNINMTGMLFSSVKPVMPFWVDFYDVIMRALISGCGLEEQIIYFGVETFCFIDSEDYGKITGRLWYLTGSASVSDAEVVVLIGVCPFIIIPFQSDPLYGQHVNLFVVAKNRKY